MGNLPQPGCLRPGCKELAARDAHGYARRYCADHEPPAAPTPGAVRLISLRDLIASGPTWDAARPLSSVELGACCACGDLVKWISASTGLCKACWRLWRFAQATTPVRVPLSSLH
jgi:hypothetical protein